MSVLLTEPDEYLAAMFEVRQRRAEAQQYGADSELME
jgi:hypothetical protein